MSNLEEDRIVTDELVELVSQMIAMRWHKSQIKRAIYDVLGRKCAPPTIEKLLRHARALLRERHDIDKTEHITDAIAFYEEILRDRNESTANKLRAQEALRMMLGLDARFAIDGNNADKAEEHAQRIRDALAYADEVTDYNAGGERLNGDGA